MFKDRIKAIKVCIAALVFLGVFLACEKKAADPDDFKAQDLSGQDFSGLAIYSFDLSGKNLQNTDFSGSNVHGTNFTNADLRGANFWWASLWRADFSNADLRGTNLVGTCFFQDAIWTGAILDPKWEKIVTSFENGQIANKDWKGYDISEVCFQSHDSIDWDSTDFSGANLENTWFVGNAAALSNTSFRNANLRSVAFVGADLTYADFTGADLRNTDFGTSNLTGAKISSAQLAQAILGNCARLPNGQFVNEEECHWHTPVTNSTP